MHSFSSLEDSFESYSNKRISHWEEKRDNTFQIFSKHYHQNILRIYKNIIPKGSRILEIGCGNGNLLASLEGSYSVGIDFSENAIAIAKMAYPQCDFFKMDAHSLDLPSNDFDFIILSDLLNDVWDVQKILEENGLTVSSVLRMYLTKIANGEIEIKLQQVYKK
jgi:ubiquinone/menaquinone biosynthesis C-methylase UbiE